MKILVAGGTGLVGRTLVATLKGRAGADVHVLSRQWGAGVDSILWDPSRRVLGDVSGYDAVINLSGENIGSGRWSAAKRAEVLDSRVRGASLLAAGLAAAKAKPAVLIQASGVGYYGAGGSAHDEVLTEAAPLGAGFLAEVAAATEAATAPAAAAGIRVVHARLAPVLTAEGGMLGQMLPPFRLYAGGPVGPASQWMS